MLHICIRYHVGCDIDFPAFHGHNLGSRLVLCITNFLFFYKLITQLYSVSVSVYICDTDVCRQVESHIVAA